MHIIYFYKLYLVCFFFFQIIAGKGGGGERINQGTVN